MYVQAEGHIIIALLPIPTPKGNTLPSRKPANILSAQYDVIMESSSLAWVAPLCYPFLIWERKCEKRLQ